MQTLPLVCRDSCFDSSDGGGNGNSFIWLQIHHNLIIVSITLDVCL